jgi:DNA-binding CsgD family transcriptional regulator
MILLLTGQRIFDGIVFYHVFTNRLIYGVLVNRVLLKKDGLIRHGDFPNEAQITALQLEIIKLLSEGYQTKEIAMAVRRAAPTVEAHIRLLFASFKSRSRAQLVARAIASGVLVVEAPQV